MTPEWQRIVIAEACGWVWVPWGGSPNFTPIDIQKLNAFAWDHPTHGRVSGPGSSERQLPDYLNDLNAMAKAEDALKGLTDFPEYVRILALVCDCPLWACVSSTAAQRAEAFLRVKGLWVE